MTLMSLARAIVVLTLLSFPSAVRAQDVSSGPDNGAKVPALKVYDATGEHKDKTVDYPAQRKDKPTVYILLRADKFDRPMNRFMRELDKLVKKDYSDAYIVAVWLTEDVEKTKDLLPRVQQSVQYEATALTYFAGDATGPKDWNVNPDAHLTIIVANKQEVAAKFGYKSVNESDVPGVREALKNAWKAK
jgi:hypothetical protein